MNCIICNSTNQELIFKGIKDLEYETYRPVDYKICKNCGLISQSPLPNPNELQYFYPEEYRNYLPVKENFFSFLKKIQFQNLADKITKELNKNPRILEIGFGNGQLLLALKEKGYENLYGCDFTDRVFSNLKDKGIKLAVSNIEESFPFNEKFNLVIMNNVIEHFLDPLKVLETCKQYLSQEGKIILITPNSNALEFLIFKKYWAGFHAPRHIFIFNDKNIKLLGKNLRFSKIEVKPMTDAGQLSISLQNVLQDFLITKNKLRNGMTWYLMPLTLISAPFAVFENLIGKSTSMLCTLALDNIRSKS